MQQTITVLQKEQYGNIVLIPVCEQAKAFARIAGTKTIRMQDVAQIQFLGFSVTVQQPAVVVGGAA